MKLNVAVRTKNLEEGAQEGRKTIEAEQKTLIFDFISSQSGLDVKEYPVKGSEGDKMRIIFTIKDQNQALHCYSKLAYRKDSII